MYDWKEYSVTPPSEPTPDPTDPRELLHKALVRDIVEHNLSPEDALQVLARILGVVLGRLVPVHPDPNGLLDLLVEEVTESAQISMQTGARTLN